MPRQHAFDQRHRLVDAHPWFGTPRLPVIPRARIHRRFGGQHGDFIIARHPVRQLQHGIGIGRIHRAAIRLGVRRIARRQRRDQRAVQRRSAGRERLCLLQRFQCRCQGLRVHRRVDIRPLHQRLAPEAECTPGRERLRLAERGDRRRMVEVVGHFEALIEPRPRLGRQPARLQRRTRHPAVKRELVRHHRPHQRGRLSQAPQQHRLARPRLLRTSGRCQPRGIEHGERRRIGMRRGMPPRRSGSGGYPA